MVRGGLNIWAVGVTPATTGWPKGMGEGGGGGAGRGKDRGRVWVRMKRSGGWGGVGMRGSIDM